MTWWPNITGRWLVTPSIPCISCQFVLCSEGCVLAAGTRGTDNSIEEGRGKKAGIVPGHAYTILQVYSPVLTLKSGIRLVKLRNPW